MRIEHALGLLRASYPWLQSVEWHARLDHDGEPIVGALVLVTDDFKGVYNTPSGRVALRQVIDAVEGALAPVYDEAQIRVGFRTEREHAKLKADLDRRRGLAA